GVHSVNRRKKNNSARPLSGKTSGLCQLLNRPNSDGAVASAGSEKLAVIVEGNRVNHRLMAKIGCQELARLSIPEAHGTVGAAGADLLSLWREGHGPDVAAL